MIWWSLLIGRWVYVFRVVTGYGRQSMGVGTRATGSVTGIPGVLLLVAVQQLLLGFN